MQTVTVDQLHEKTGDILQQLAGNGEIIVTDCGKPIAILTDVLGNDLDNSLLALKRVRAIAALKSIQEDARKAGLDKMSLEEINEEVRAARATG
jgi:Phd_YefM.